MEEAVQTYGYQCARCGARYAAATGFCLKCMEVGVVYPRAWRPTDHLIPEARGTTARALVASRQQSFPAKPYPFRVAPASLLIFYGPMGSGKSTTGFRCCQAQVPSLIICLEEGVGEAVANRLRRLEIISDQVRIENPGTINEMVDLVLDRAPAFTLIDSLNVCSFIPADVLKLARSQRGVICGVLQMTKAGDAAGPRSWLHDADVVVRVEAGHWYLEKSRYQELPLEGEIQ